MDAAVVEGAIPQESIRLRILAHSDSPQDQAVKRHVRDAIVAEMAGWANGPQTIEEARQTLQAHMQELSEVIAEQLESRGFHYGYEVELGVVPFPTKMYGSRIYPAGEYEALRVSLGEGAGQNWWCVLFPPLCFIDAVSGEATTAVPAAAAAATVQAADAGTQAPADSADITEAAAPQVKFFLWELIQSIIAFFRNLFG